MRGSVPPVCGIEGTGDPLAGGVVGGAVVGGAVVGGTVPGSVDGGVEGVVEPESDGELLGSPDASLGLAEPGSWVHPFGGCCGSQVAPPAGSDATGLEESAA